MRTTIVLLISGIFSQITIDGEPRYYEPVYVIPKESWNTTDGLYPNLDRSAYNSTNPKRSEQVRYGGDFIASGLTYKEKLAQDQAKTSPPTMITDPRVASILPSPNHQNPIQETNLRSSTTPDLNGNSINGSTKSNKVSEQLSDGDSKASGVRHFTTIQNHTEAASIHDLQGITNSIEIGDNFESRQGDTEVLGLPEVISD